MESLEEIKLSEECRQCIKHLRYGGQCPGKITLKKSCILFEKTK